MKNKDLPRGIRNNNPGNIEDDGKTQWQNLATPRSDGRFLRFKTAPDGIRALCRVLITYQDKRRAKDGSRIDTVREIIERWAPPNENNTGAYTQAVRRSMGLDGEEFEGELDVHEYNDLKPLVRAIIRHENGMQPYTDAQIDKGLLMAGVHPPSDGKPLQKNLVVQSTQAGVVGTVGSGAVGLTTIATLGEQLQDAADQISPLAYYGKWLMIAFVVLSLTALGVTLYAKHKERQQGVG